MGDSDATTSYGTWANHVGDLTVEDTVRNYLADQAEGYDVDRIVAAYRRAVNNILPRRVSLAGNDFYGPYRPYRGEFNDYPAVRGPRQYGYLEIAELVDRVDLDAIVAAHELNPNPTNQ